LKKLSVEQRNFILTGDPAFTFDPTPYELAWRPSPGDRKQELQQQEEVEEEDPQPQEEQEILDEEENVFEEEILVEQEEEVIQTPVTPHLPKRVRRTEAQLLLPSSPLSLTDGQLRSGRVWKTPPPPGSTPWTRPTATSSPSSSASFSSKSLGARLKGAAKSILTVPPPPGRGRTSSQQSQPEAATSLGDVLKRRDAETERRLGSLRQPQHLTDQFGPSRFPTLTQERPEEKEKKKKEK
jgi:hypothetical protein